MDREGIKQRVLDVLGIILVDKTQIHDQASLEELHLDEEDIVALFQRLEHRFACRFPAFLLERARHRPEHVSLPMIVDLLVLMQHEPEPPDKRQPPAGPACTRKRRP